jgi:hypothetical protein
VWAAAQGEGSAVPLAQADAVIAVPASQAAQAGSQAVAAYLTSHGLDPAALQRKQPEAYSKLALDLAKVLCQVHADMVEGNGDKGPGSRHGHPAELMVRICLFSQELGLSAADITELWHEQPDVLRFR